MSRKFMKRVLMILCAIVLFLVLIMGIVIKNTTFTKSPDGSYTIAGVCFDIGGAGYLGNYYLINNKTTVLQIYDTGCNTPGVVGWQADNEFSINNRNGTYNFIISDDGLIAN